MSARMMRMLLSVVATALILVGQANGAVYLTAQQADGTWHIDGVKRFITSADSDDLFENIMHLVLARPEGAGPGTKGLSLFFVPKFHFDPETGEPGERNGAVLLANELLRADSIHFLLGQAINPHYQNPLLPRSISIRRNLVEQIAEFLRGLNKEVEIEYC